MDHPPPHAVPDHAPGHEPGNGDELRDALLAAEHRNSALRRRMERERDRADALERHLASIPPPPPPVDLSEFHRRLDEQQARLDAQRSLLDDQGELIGKQHRLIAAGENAAAAARAELDALTASTAWKLTWPIRRVLAGHPHLARRARRLLRGLWWSATLQLPRRLRERAGRESIAFAEPAAPFAPEFASDAVADIAPGITEPEAQLPFGGSETGTTTVEAAPPAEPPVQPPVELPVLATAARPVVSIVIPCFGQVPVTLRCLRAVAASETRTPFEVIVAEDASGDPAVALLERVEGLRLLRNERNLGFLHNCNAAVARARGRFILLLNNDTEPLPGFLDALVGLLEARPDAGLVGSKLLFPDGRLQEAGGVLWQDGSGWNYGRGEDPALPRYNTVRDTDYISGASIMLRRELWELIGGFDPRYAPAYYEDADLAFQVRARGLRVLFQPSSVVIHHEGLSHGTDPSAGVKANQEVNRHRMVARWPNLLRREHLPPWQHPLLAAEHARGRRMVLVIDHYVPQPDRDAGSRSALAILRALRADGRVVKFWPQNRGHDSYTATLEVMGVEVLDDREPGHFPDWIARHGGVLDQVLVLRPTVAVEFISPLLAHTKARLCFYGLDIYHRRMRRQALLLGDSELLREAAEMERIERRLWGVFDASLHPSEEEAAIVRGAVPSATATAIVPFCFDRFRVRMSAPASTTVLFVAGFAHPPNIDAACWLVAEILPLLRVSHPDVRLVLAGSHPTDRVRALAGEGVEVTGTLSEEELQERYDGARVAVVPLRCGAGVKGKVVEALQQGIPLVTTPIGAEGLPGIDGVVSVADDAGDFADHVRRLLEDDVLWYHRSMIQRTWVGQRFNRDTFAASLFRALDDPLC